MHSDRASDWLYGLAGQMRLILGGHAGLFGRVPPPCGPTIERYGSAQPWPWDRYELS